MRSQGDVVLFGVFLPGAVLGVYILAKTLTDAAEGLLERLNGTLTLPVLSEVVRNNPEHLSNRYYRFRLPIDLVAGTCGGFLFMTADLVIAILYDSRYAEAGPMLRLLALGLAIYPVSLIRTAFTAVGNTRMMAVGSLVQAAAQLSLLLVGFYVAGALGGIAGSVAGRLFPAAVMLFAGYRHGWISVGHELRVLGIFVAGLMFGKIALLISVAVLH